MQLCGIYTTFAEAHVTAVPRFGTYIALFLLLLFGRVMTPDALLLRLHHHHTTHTAHTADNKEAAQLSEKHTHCPVEDLFGAPYQSSLSAVAFTPATHTTVYQNQYQGYWQSAAFSCYRLRGPPAV